MTNFVVPPPTSCPNDGETLQGIRAKFGGTFDGLQCGKCGYRFVERYLGDPPAPDRTREELPTLSEMNNLVWRAISSVTRPVGAVEELLAAITALHGRARQGVEANEDTARLDWLEEQGAQAWIKVLRCEVSLDRAAIDAARAARVPETQEGTK